MTYLTLRLDETAHDRRRAAIEDVVRRHGGTSEWRTHGGVGRSYALLEVAGPDPRAEIAAVAQGTLYDTAVIALAVSPTVPQALPALYEALGGSGRPAAVLDCRESGSTLLLEWSLDAALPGLILGVIDAELRRFASGRITELLNPLPPHVVTRLAADGLGAPEIEPKRVLDLLLDDG
ncbi:MAG: hypothetical protein JO263_06480 [Candidatus Eremiobacteraeota bacterium]|nr:hypothetical protein [Candidatus Eremiobacteraeota bacterium]